MAAQQDMTTHGNRTDISLQILSDMGRMRVPVQNVYRLLFRSDLYPKDYGLTPEQITEVQKRLTSNTFQWSERTHFYREDGRKISVPCRQDRYVASGMARILSAYFDVTMDERAYGFRPERGPAAAIKYIQTWSGIDWLEHWDIRACFPAIRKAITVGTVAQGMRDWRFNRLLVRAIPTGNLIVGDVLSPVLANIVLRGLDATIPHSVRFCRYADNILIGWNWKTAEAAAACAELGEAMGFQVKRKPLYFLGCDISLNPNNGTVIATAPPGPMNSGRYGYYKGLGVL